MAYRELLLTNRKSTICGLIKKSKQRVCFAIVASTSYKSKTRNSTAKGVPAPSAANAAPTNTTYLY